VKSLIDVVEAAYSLDGDERAWLSGLATAALPALDRGCGVLAYVANMKDLSPVTFATARMPDALVHAVRGVGELSSATVNDTFRRQPMRFVAVSEAFLGDDVLREHANRTSVAAGAVDGVGVYVHASPERSVHLFAFAPTVQRPTTRERDAWVQVAVHLASAYRVRGLLGGMRKIEDRADAILDGSGRVHHARDEATSSGARSALRDAVRDRERARGPMRRRDSERALGLWRGLVAGTWSLVDRWDADGKRFISAIANAPPNLDPRALSPREGATARLAADGASAKDIAYALGVSPSNARALLAAALAKLGLRSRAELYRWNPADAAVHVLETDPPIHALAIPDRDPAGWKPEASLTTAELEVARLAAQGRSNAEIAEARDTSVRTVANQMAKILRKLGVSSRADILRSAG
jgi:DNA-binding CsgD family transcriptional regulator